MCKFNFDDSLKCNSISHLEVLYKSKCGEPSIIEFNLDGKSMIAISIKNFNGIEKYISLSDEMCKVISDYTLYRSIINKTQLIKKLDNIQS